MRARRGLVDDVVAIPARVAGAQRECVLEAVSAAEQAHEDVPVQRTLYPAGSVAGVVERKRLRPGTRLAVVPLGGDVVRRCRGLRDRKSIPRVRRQARRQVALATAAVLLITVPIGMARGGLERVRAGGDRG